MHFLLKFLALSSFFQASAVLSLALKAELLRDAEVTPRNGAVSYMDGVNTADIPQRPSAVEIVSAAISRNGWSVTCDSSQTGNECNQAIDGNDGTFWQTEKTPVNAALPHWIMIDMKKSYAVGNVTIEPRQDGSSDGHIGEHTISLR